MRIFLVSLCVVFCANWMAYRSTAEVTAAKNLRGSTTVSPLSISRTTLFKTLASRFRSSKFPIIPPRPWMKPTTPIPINRKNNNGGGALITTGSPSIADKPPAYENVTESANKLDADIFDISSSEDNPSVSFWPIPRRPFLHRFRTHSARSTTPRPIPKLLLPRPTRPAMYSLDGFVPKPSIIRTTTTDAPLQLRASFNRVISVSPRRRKYSQYNSNLEDDPFDRSTKRFGSGPKKHISRYTAFARKGIPGSDYPVHGHIPKTQFDCTEQSRAGMYADPETGCQVWHMCPGYNQQKRHSFLCPNGTIFNEKSGVCDWWYNVDCPTWKKRQSERFGRSVELKLPEASWTMNDEDNNVE